MFITLALSSIFISASQILQRNPKYIHTPYKWKNKKLEEAIIGKKIQLISHRGGSYENFENTQKAFQDQKSKTDIIEIDVHLTKDKKIVILHDNYLQRLCGIDEFVENVNFDQIKYKKQIETNFSTNNILKVGYQPQPIIYNGKQNKNKYLIQTKQWGSFDYKFAKKIMEKNKEIPRFFSRQEYIKIYFSYIFGILPFLNLKAQIFQVPFYTLEYYEWKKKEAQNSNLNTLMVNIVFTYLKFFNSIQKGINQHLNKRGILVYYWVLNDEKYFQQALQTKPNGIITDCPTKLRKFLNKLN
ncbi:hypothetical protein IMG5_109040 [Ichthyophthirius multifiliis]|uniref:GP-PDE domain-containing protein n=1 Tax=Ichthyophthirius multifiliis TaxID=5932 RepID=G0QTK4_ICHMU|nr:hypothetical protein IMG5_109040 [Ichthyophthirius multifiliis]EGR31455.1 hypothetical protein IMG5_109040 [Ichthyophthirius multifiliis]|eukprot:XP_004034941.1 hypothetical protein IMG5_109040 [Ichthyophthirius multifiliis]